MLLSKRRSQLKQVVQEMVRQCMAYAGGAPDRATKIELLKTLQALTEGKVRRSSSFDGSARRPVTCFFASRHLASSTADLRGDRARPAHTGAGPDEGGGRAGSRGS